MKPYVIVVAGSVGSGKSTIIAALSRVLDSASILIFDHYHESVVWPEDMEKWMREGCDPRKIRVPKMKEDLDSLLRGDAIRNPQGEVVKSSRYIVVEEPSGREREEIRGEVDYVVYIDTPQDICVVRMIERVMNGRGKKEKDSLRRKTKEEQVKQLEKIGKWIQQYNLRREMYVRVSKRVKKSADLVVDGMETVEEITTRIVKEIRKISGKQD